jgi:hypothetical protein
MIYPKGDLNDIKRNVPSCSQGQYMGQGDECRLVLINAQQYLVKRKKGALPPFFIAIVNSLKSYISLQATPSDKSYFATNPVVLIIFLRSFN